MPQFINRNKNIHFSCEEIIDPASVDDVVALVNRARTIGRRIKAVGGAHSFNNDIKTDGNLVDLGRMNRVLSVDRQRNTAIVEAGITLADAIAALDGVWLHFPSLGSWSGQTIAGAIATSTHGSTLRHGTLSDIITGVEVVLSDGSVVWVSEGDRLRALRAHLGHLGLITKVELACVPAFILGCKIREVSDDDGFTVISGLAREHEYISMLWLPYLEQCSIRILSHSTALSRNELAAERAREF
jgi:FAD/FMN-containing dehydrogenase